MGTATALPSSGHHAKHQCLSQKPFHYFEVKIYSIYQAPSSQSLGVFTSVIVICSLGALAVTVQAKVCRLSST
jgi:hypothetical protein